MRLLLFLMVLPFLGHTQHQLLYQGLPQTWQEALPMGNGLLGCLVWEKNGHLRLALDRADLWDSRPMNGLDRPEFNYQWVAQQVASGQYGMVQEYFDAPYEREAGPTKIPGGALEFDLSNFRTQGTPTATLDIQTGLSTVTWPHGKRFESFVHATKNEGWFRFTGLTDTTHLFQLLVPRYHNNVDPQNANSVQGSDLARLGYPQSAPFQRNGVWLFHQSGWGGFSYEIAVTFKQVQAGIWEGVWSISSHFPQKIQVNRAEQTVKKAISRGFKSSLAASATWWTAYWAQSTVSLPDSVLDRQYHLDLYKFGCCARENGPMISLQAIWTADNGRLPPWKGDLHHDLNTQMSYWPAYASNHLSEGWSYLRHLESNETAHRLYTQRFFGNDGLNIPGVSTLLGAAMGGWIQYACSPTTAAWCAQHFYLHWQYSRDKNFLRHHAWPWLEPVAEHLLSITKISPETGKRVLPLSSSPEIGDNSINAWFPDTWTNYDLALTRFVFEKTAELALELNLPKEATHWQNALESLPAYALEPSGALMFAPTLPYRESHRHFSHIMAIHPLGLLDWSDPADQKIIRASLHLLDSIGTSSWCGYSYAWLGNLRARAHDGTGARDALRIFAEAFVSKNSFHLNGDQSGKGYSSFTYDPFTLEGNFAFAAGVLEMLLQSHNGVIRVFPAVPVDWESASFRHLRTQGAFLVSAEIHNHKPDAITVLAEAGGTLKLQLPPGNWTMTKKRSHETVSGLVQQVTSKGESLTFKLQ
jgi:hypothetical protein